MGEQIEARATTMDLIRVLGNWVGDSDREAARVIKGLGGQDVLQYFESPAVIQMQLDGRPDGLAPGDHETMLRLLQEQQSQQPQPRRIMPQQWIELDREFVQFQQRRKALLMTAASAQLSSRVSDAIRFYGLVQRDADHCLEIIDFAQAEHPSGQLIHATPDHRPAIWSQKCVARAQSRVLGNDHDGAVETLKEGVVRVSEALDINGVSDPAANSWVRDLLVLERTIRKRQGIDRTLAERLEDALAAEDFETAAALRDRINQNRQAAIERAVPI